MVTYLGSKDILIDQPVVLVGTYDPQKHETVAVRGGAVRVRAGPLESGPGPRLARQNACRRGPVYRRPCVRPELLRRQ